MLINNTILSKALVQGIRDEHHGIFWCDFGNKIAYKKLSGQVMPSTIDFSNTFGTSDKITECNLIIINSKLYHINSSNQAVVFGAVPAFCTSISGTIYSNSLDAAYCVSAGYLYEISYNNTGTAYSLKVGSDNTWTMVSGTYYTYETGYPTTTTVTTYAYGINNGKLYCLAHPTANTSSATTTVTVVKSGSTTITGWTFIQGSSNTSGSVTSGTYGIANGKLYKIIGSSASQVGTMTGWTEVRGHIGTAFGLCNGELYGIVSTTNNVHKTVKVEEANINGNWTSYTNHFLINNGKLYYAYLYESYDELKYSIQQLGTDTKWSMVSGQGVGNAYAWGINTGVVFKLYNDGYQGNGFQTDVQQCVGIYGGLTGFAVCNLD